MYVCIYNYYYRYALQVQKANYACYVYILHCSKIQILIIATTHYH